MNKLIFILLSFLFVVTGNEYCQASGHRSLKEELVHGKWVNKTDGYIPNAVGTSDRTVARYKTYSFWTTALSPWTLSNSATRERGS